MGHYVVNLFHYIIHWIYYSRIGSLCNGPNWLCSVYIPFIVELRPYVLDAICYILNLIDLRHFTIINQIGYVIEKTRYIYVCFCCNLIFFQCHQIGLYHINANPIWIFGHNITLMLASALINKNVNNQK
jgi:hypothetical protein